ncbi:MAG: hypothetical protein AB8F95_05485 [Bacteroidia bacterium]
MQAYGFTKIAHAFLLILLAVGIVISIQAGGDFGFTYPVDDAYIHLAIAEQFWAHGSFGIHPDSFCMSSSSPGYTILLALTGGWNSMPFWLPLALNTFAALSVLSLILKQWKKSDQTDIPATQKQSWRYIIWAIIFIVLTPLGLLVLNGMEHAWQLWANLWLLIVAGKSEGQVSLKKLGLAATLSSLFRYEGLFLAGSVAFLFLVKKRYKEALITFLGSILPVCIIGLYSLSRGGSFLPLTLLGKGQAPWQVGLATWLRHGMEVLYEHPFMLILLVAMLGVVYVVPKGPKAFQAAAVALCILPQVWLAQVGGYRYEAYLIGLGLWIALPFIWKFVKQKESLAWVIAGVCLFPFMLRAGYFTANHGAAVFDIAHQHRATAAFLNTHYPTASIALNDIGAVAYETDCRITDLNGITDPPMMKAKLAGTCTPAFVDSLSKARGVTIAALHASFVGDAIPPHWVKTHAWELPHYFMTADPVLSWFAVDSTEAIKLKAYHAKASN